MKKSQLKKLIQEIVKEVNDWDGINSPDANDLFDKILDIANLSDPSYKLISALKDAIIRRVKDQKELNILKQRFEKEFSQKWDYFGDKTQYQENIKENDIEGQGKAYDLGFGWGKFAKEWLGKPLETGLNAGPSPFGKAYSCGYSDGYIGRYKNLFTGSQRYSPQPGITENDETTNTHLINGQSNSVAAGRVNKVLAALSKGIFSDESWEAINKIFEKLNKLGLEVTVISAKYGGQNDTSNGMPKYKEWQISIPFTNKVGKPMELVGPITAHGAGSIEQPLDRYDITAYVSAIPKRG